MVTVRGLKGVNHEKRKLKKLINSANKDFNNGFIKEVRKLIDMSEIYEALRTSNLRKVTYEGDEISIVAYKVGKIIRIDVREVIR